MQRLLFIMLFVATIPAAIVAQYPNIMIGNNFSPNEPTICINPKNPAQMAAGSNIDNYYYSSDFGQTWTSGILTSTMGVWGDPVIIADTSGHFYFFHLSNTSSQGWLDRIVCQKSTNGGISWNNGSYMGLNGTKDQDKEWAVVDPANNNIYVCWTQFDQYNSTAPLDSSNIMFSRSIDAGISWSPARRINDKAGDCLDMDNTVEGAVPAVGPNGEVYVSWAGTAGLVFTRSTDGGITWPSTNMVIGDIPGGWDFNIPGIYRTNGLPVTCCDLSNGPYRGKIYINWTDQRNGEDDTDVWIVESTDGGNTFTPPKRVNNDPPGKQQFFSWMTIDQLTGYIYIVFYDRRNYSDNLTDVYMAVSKDGGDNFSNFKISDTPFNPFSSIFFGDYTHIAAHNNIVRPIWTRLQVADLTIMTALVDNIFVGTPPEKETIAPFSLEQNYPNPARDLTYITYKIMTASRISLTVYDLYGKEVALLIKGQIVEPGKYIQPFDRVKYGLPPGFYHYSLSGTETVLRRKMVLK